MDIGLCSNMQAGQRNLRVQATARSRLTRVVASPTT